MAMQAMSSQWQVKQSTGHPVFRKESAAECQKGAKWLKGVLNSQESAEWSGGRPEGIKAPNNQDGKECSQESDRSPRDQQDIERRVVSRGRLAVRRAT